MSRTYNVPTAKVAGTFGQAIPGIPADNLIMQNETKRIIFMSENDDLRANLGCVNGVNDNVRIAITLYDDDGRDARDREHGSRTVVEQPDQPDLRRLRADQRLCRRHRRSRPAPAYYCYGSVLDNGSNDPTTILPQ